MHYLELSEKQTLLFDIVTNVMIFGAKGTKRNFFERESSSDNRPGFDFKVKEIR